LSETIWHPSQKFEKQKDGSAIMTLQITGTYEFLAWVLGWGEKVEVLEPPEIRKTIIKTVEAMGEIYC
jgi:predicted DNA-binding transcriptional regulator YafY